VTEIVLIFGTITVTTLVAVCIMASFAAGAMRRSTN